MSRVQRTTEVLDAEADTERPLPPPGEAVKGDGLASLRLVTGGTASSSVSASVAGSIAMVCSQVFARVQGLERARTGSGTDAEPAAVCLLGSRLDRSAAGAAEQNSIQVRDCR